MPRSNPQIQDVRIRSRKHKPSTPWTIQDFGQVYKREIRSEGPNRWPHGKAITDGKMPAVGDRPRRRRRFRPPASLPHTHRSPLPKPHPNSSDRSRRWPPPRVAPPVSQSSATLEAITDGNYPKKRGRRCTSVGRASFGSGPKDLLPAFFHGARNNDRLQGTDPV
jgi:hypothetical protein